MKTQIQHRYQLRSLRKRTPRVVAHWRADCARTAYDRAAVPEALETHLRFEPAKAKRRIKPPEGGPAPRLRGLGVFHDIAEEEVQVLAVVATVEAQAWLDSFGEPAP